MDNLDVRFFLFTFLGCITLCLCLCTLLEGTRGDIRVLDAVVILVMLACLFIVLVRKLF